MAKVEEYNDRREIDMESLLAAIQRQISGEVKEFMEDEPASPVKLNQAEYNVCAELAKTFELDIHDFTISEITR